MYNIERFSRDSEMRSICMESGWLEECITLIWREIVVETDLALGG